MEQDIITAQEPESRSEPQANLFNGNQIEQAPHNSNHNKKFLISAVIVVLLIILIAGAGVVLADQKGYTVQGFSVVSPKGTWNKFINQSAQTSYNTQYTVNYTDSGSLEGAEQLLGFPLKDIKLTISGNGYANLTNLEKPELETDLKYSFGSGNTTLSSGIKIRALNEAAYYDLSSIPFVSAIFEQLGYGEATWIKVDYKSLTDQSGVNPSQLMSAENQKKFQDIWVKYPVLKYKKFIDKEEVNNINTIHVIGEIDKNQLRSALYETFNTLGQLDPNNPAKPEDLAVIRSITDKLVEKLESTEVDLWIGSKDQRLYKLSGEMKVPSLITMIKDAQRLSANNPAPASGETTEEYERKIAKQFIDQLKFTANLSLEFSYTDYGLIKQVEEPKNAIDIFKEIEKNQQLQSLPQ